MEKNWMQIFWYIMTNYKWPGSRLTFFYIIPYYFHIFITVRTWLFMVQTKRMSNFVDCDTSSEATKTQWNLLFTRRSANMWITPIKIEKIPEFDWIILKDTQKIFDDFKNKQQKSVWSNVFWYVQVCVFWKRIQYTIHWDKTQTLKNFPSDKIKGTKNALFFLSRATTHHSFTFNLWFLYELKHKVRLSKTVCGNFHFKFRLVFIKVYIFVKQNTWTLWL